MPIIFLLLFYGYQFTSERERERMDDHMIRLEIHDLLEFKDYNFPIWKPFIVTQEWLEENIQFNVERIVLKKRGVSGYIYISTYGVFLYIDNDPPLIRLNDRGCVENKDRCLATCVVSKQEDICKIYIYDVIHCQGKKRIIDSIVM